MPLPNPMVIFNSTKHVTEFKQKRKVNLGESNNDITTLTEQNTYIKADYISL
ncbi:hypothetical protein C1645_815575 [Glomus cerebriforme]|uniref:Uncharacterized protein n=1 Tax=Glomus cerebriforme TaxID=658196 RepID=A0A397TFY9_9GLOM|nr:hypothetical protein C1645_815575 [Glomus cerebriforme]